MKSYIVLALFVCSISAFASPKGSFTCQSTQYIGNKAEGKSSVLMIIEPIQQESSTEKEQKRITIKNSYGAEISELATTVELYMTDSMYISIEHSGRTFAFGTTYDGSLQASYQILKGSANNSEDIDIISESCNQN
jgi:hypothetical protein